MSNTLPVSDRADEEIAEVAGKLTKAQREAVLGRRRLDSGAGMWSLRGALRRLGLVEGFGAHPTPLWHVVRAHLERQQ